MNGICLEIRAYSWQQSAPVNCSMGSQCCEHCSVISHSAVVFTGDFQFRAVLSKVVVVFMYRSLCRYVFSGSRISSSKETCHLTSFY